MTAAPRVRLALVVAVLSTSAAAGGWVLGRGFRAPDSAAGARLFDQVLAHVATQYVDSIGLGDLYARASAGLVAELGDPYSVFLDSVRLARVQASITGLIGSLGLTVDARDGWVNVVAAYPNTPSEQVGLRAGDRITSIDGRSTRDWTVDEARRALRGAPGTSVRLTVVRLGAGGRTTDLVLHREAVYIHPIRRSLMLNGDVGYVHLVTFSDSAAFELAESVDSLHSLGMRKLVLDLRGNPGGLLAQGTAVADLFLDPGQPIVSLRGRIADARRTNTDEHPQRWNDLNIAVLVDRGTASAAELVAGALQDHDRAVVIGRPTYGKGSAQSLFSFHDAAGVKLTTSRWYTPLGRNIEYVATAEDADPASESDSLGRPIFRTASGRVVFGGGGIVPDILAGDTVNVPRVTLFTTLGARAREFRTLVSEEAAAIGKQGPPAGGVMFDVTPAMRDGVYRRMQRAGIEVPRAEFDAASEWLDRILGAEVVRHAYGRAEESRRSVLRDRVVQRAISELNAR